jgi:hypothetical protein
MWRRDGCNDLDYKKNLGVMKELNTHTISHGIQRKQQI